MCTDPELLVRAMFPHLRTEFGLEARIHNRDSLPLLHPIGFELGTCTFGTNDFDSGANAARL